LLKIHLVSGVRLDLGRLGVEFLGHQPQSRCGLQVEAIAGPLQAGPCLLAEIVCGHDLLPLACPGVKRWEEESFRGGWQRNAGL
jgi:hypothetical protein